LLNGRVAPSKQGFKKEPKRGKTKENGPERGKREPSFKGGAMKTKIKNLTRPDERKVKTRRMPIEQKERETNLGTKGK